ncbi:hypothetical protein [Propioniciclava sinopodophylli]|uniref:hypothetical protein n=1 Tax=Propioniciclava sinopodophylli TaxID=1837344 RepID=UPI0024922883|nr:hypothetical protein [Propioniciclava sinopodophylli]
MARPAAQVQHRVVAGEVGHAFEQPLVQRLQGEVLGVRPGPVGAHGVPRRDHAGVARGRAVRQHGGAVGSGRRLRGPVRLGHRAQRVHPAGLAAP